MKNLLLKFNLVLLFILALNIGYSQNGAGEETAITPFSSKKFSIYTTWLTFSNFGNPKTNTHHYEIQAGYQWSPKNKIGIKVATWKLFAPMGIPLWDPAFLDENYFYPGRLQETGIGLTYQRMLKKRLFTAVEVMPLRKTYLDVDKMKVGNGFKLYMSYHLGYNISLFKGRLFIAPQIHLNHWPINTGAPEAFAEAEASWNNYFFFEPNLYIGINF